MAAGGSVIASSELGGSRDAEAAALTMIDFHDALGADIVIARLLDDVGVVLLVGQVGDPGRDGVGVTFQRQTQVGDTGRRSRAVHWRGLPVRVAHGSRPMHVASVVVSNR